MQQVVELIGVYHASGTLWGELSYWVGARLGRAHCALCDITHGTFRPRRDWADCASGLGVPFTTFHLDDRPGDVAAASDDATPCVLARTASGELVMVVGPEVLERCGGDPAELVQAIEVTMAGRGLGFDGEPTTPAVGDDAFGGPAGSA